MENNEENVPIDAITLAEIQKSLDSFVESQRLSIILIWVGIIMVTIHIIADIYFHVFL